MILEAAGGVRYIFHSYQHEHPLILAYSTTEAHDGGWGIWSSCSSCHKSHSGMTYGCRRCDFYLHKSCMGDPDVIENHLHDHPLTRDLCTGSSCSCCSSTYSHPSNFYKCSECDFSLDEKCALAVPERQDPSESCQLCHSAMVLIEKEEEDEEEERCIMCHERCCSGPIYCCPVCKYSFHKSCYAGLTEIQHPSHPFRPLTRNELRIFKCNNCLEDRYSTSYHFQESDFDLDFKCAFLVPRKELEGKEHILSDLHRHPLTLTEDTTRSSDEDCIVCYEPCPHSTYACRGCNVYVIVHKSCAIAKIPDCLHPTVLQTRPFQKSRGSFTCGTCRKDRTGYYYGLISNQDSYFYSPSIDKRPSDLKVDLRCAYLEQPLIIFDGHSHPLIFIVDFDGHGKCDACGERCESSAAFHCPTCDIKLHLTCGPLPCSIKQETHLEILVLKDSHMGDWEKSEEFYCDSCEDLVEGRDPRECVYYCARCNYCAEIKCVMPEIKNSLTGKSGDIELRSVGRWGRSGKVLSKGLLSEEMHRYSREATLTGTKSEWSVGGVTRRLHERLKLRRILDGNEKLFEDLSRNGGGTQDAKDDEFIQLVEKLDSVKLTDLQKSWEYSRIRLVRVGEHRVPENLLHVYNDLHRKYGDLAAEAKLSPRLKALFFLPLCEAVEGICSTKVVDITEDHLRKWWISLKAVRRAGYKVQFTLDALKTVLCAYYGLRCLRKLDQEIESLEQEIPTEKAELEKLEGQLKRHKEYYESKELSLVKACTEEASSLMYQTIGEVILL